jgi:hypothetical protein
LCGSLNFQEIECRKTLGVFIEFSEFDGIWRFLAFPCFRVGMHALPLCGAALTFFAAAKKVSKESRSNR